MKHNQLIFGLLPVLLFLSSCVTSINPIVTSQNIVATDAVIGKWQSTDYDVTIEKLQGSDVDQYVEKGTAKETPDDRIKKMHPDERKIYLNTYLARFRKNGFLHLMGLKFTRINNELYAQVEAVAALKTTADKISEIDSNQLEEKNEPFTQSAYSFAKVIFSNKNLQLQFLNTDYIETLISKGAIAIKYEEDTLFETKVITASPEELRKFISKYGQDKRLFSEENTILLHKRS